MEEGGNSWVGTYNPLWYEQDYFTKDPYNPYQDFDRHNAAFTRLIHVMNPKSVLDVGCAYGYIVKRLLDKGIHAMGCDVSEWCEEQSKLIIPGHFTKTTAWDLSCFKDKEFDVLFSEGTLEHIPEDKIDKMVEEFARVAERRYIGLSPNYPNTRYHVCNHDIEWWFSKMPPNTWLGKTGRSLDQEDQWLVKC